MDLIDEARSSMLPPADSRYPTAKEFMALVDIAFDFDSLGLVLAGSPAVDANFDAIAFFG